jgi:hypothetical protein
MIRHQVEAVQRRVTATSTSGVGAQREGVLGKDQHEIRSGATKSQPRRPFGTCP